MTISTSQAEAFIKDIQPLLQDVAFMRAARYQQERNWTICLKLKETHYCRILQWLLSSHEGHGLRDFFLKRLLMAASQEASSSQQETEITLDQIVTASLGAAVVENEVMLDPANGQYQRLDLLIVDPMHRLVAVIERKDGSPLGADQLMPYERWISATYPDYRKIFILSDHNEREHDLNRNRAWIQIGDTWLVEALNEALIPGRLPPDMHQRLEDIVAHFDYEHPWRDTFFTGIQQELNQVTAIHRELIGRLADNPITDLTKQDIMTVHLSRLSAAEPIYRALLLRLQYGPILDELIERDAFQALQERLQDLYRDDTLCFEPEPHRLCITTQRMEALYEADDTLRYWPVSLVLSFPTPSASDLGEGVPGEDARPTISLEIDMEALGPERKEELRQVAERRGMKPSIRYASRTDTLPSEEAVLDNPLRLLPWLKELREMTELLDS